LKSILEKTGFTHQAKNTIQDKDTLLESLKDVVRLGYAIDNEEYEEGVVCVGAPVFDYTKQVVAGICISAPKLRMTRKRIENKLSILVIEAGKEISRRLGYNVKSI
jgi:DNA-binding IclR family transcriptional regulator